MQITENVKKYIEGNADILKKHSDELAEMYKKCFVRTFEIISPNVSEDGCMYFGSGDIEAMWMRDSSTQLWNYIRFADDPEIGALIRGLFKRQVKHLTIDPYANAFNETPSGEGHTEDRPLNDPWVFERKYEIDSLAYPIRIIYHYWKKTGDDEFLRENFPKAIKIIVDVWKTEQYHFEKSPYRFFRDTDRYNDTIHNNGMGEPVGYTGMTWQGFRPSDDGGTYGYSIPANIFAYITLGYADEILTTLSLESELVKEIRILREQIFEGVKKYGIIEHEKYGKMFAYEVDGLGNHHLMDDANTPSLISLPYIGFNDPEFEEIYENTRRFVLSTDNPYYYVGKAAKGLGSPHEYTGYIWHMGISMQGLTAKDPKEAMWCLETVLATNAGTGYTHECFDRDDPTKYRRWFFPWSDSLFCELAERCIKDKMFD